MVDYEQQKECSWCGCPEESADKVTKSEEAGCWNRRGEWFCCKSHRNSSNRALKQLLDQ